MYIELAHKLNNSAAFALNKKIFLFHCAYSVEQILKESGRNLAPRSMRQSGPIQYCLSGKVAKCESQPLVRFFFFFHSSFSLPNSKRMRRWEKRKKKRFEGNERTSLMFEQQ